MSPSKRKFWETTLTIDRARASNDSFSSVTDATESLELSDNATASKRPKKQFESGNILELGYRVACGWVGGEGGKGEVGVLQNIMRALCAVIWPDQFKFASYGPELPAT